MLADAPGPEEPSNAKYGIDPGVVLYTHCPADTDPPIRSGLSEMISEVATFSADCIIQAHQTDLRITEHYTDTAGLITAAIDHWNTVYTGSPHDLLKIVR